MTSHELTLSGVHVGGMLFDDEIEPQQTMTYFSKNFEEIVFHRNDGSVFLTLSREDIYGDKNNKTIKIQEDYIYDIVKH
jgi:hypothetical protein